jgi:hypothetical protein
MILLVHKWRGINLQMNKKIAKTNHREIGNEKLNAGT